jgi:Protein of unknown function (DUF3429)
MTDNTNLLRLLPIAGAIPFIAGALALAFGIRDLFVFGSVQAAVLSYALLIVSFMSGVHWGQHLSGARTRVNLLISSNIAALAAWFGFLLLPKSAFCVLLTVLFIVLNSIDGHLHEQGVIDSRYKQMRNYVTAATCVSLLIVGYL